MRSCSIESMPFAMPHFLIRTGTHQGRLPSVVYFDTIQHRHTSIQQTSIFPAYRVVAANLQITIDYIYIYQTTFYTSFIIYKYIRRLLIVD